MALVLCLDDDETVARLLADVVVFCKHEAVVETSSIEAVSRWLRDDRLKAVLVDYMMPRMDGIEVLECFRDSRPDVRRILVTAAPDYIQAVRKAEKEGLVSMVIKKPPSLSDLKLALAWL